MAYAARHPEHIRHLITVDSAAPKWSDTVFLFKDIFPEGQERADSFTFADALGDKPRRPRPGSANTFTGCSTRPRSAMRSSPRSAVASTTRPVNEAIDHDVQRFDLNPELRKYKFPTLVITGRYDINVAPSVAYKMHKAIPGSKFVVFEKSGHLPFFEEPEPFVRALEAFLGAPR